MKILEVEELLVIEESERGTEEIIVEQREGFKMVFDASERVC